VRLAQAVPPEEERDFEGGNPASEAEFEIIWQTIQKWRNQAISGECL
jgi:hypothetical protein